ncbi:MAG: hypothetical protein ACP5EN_03700, partial [Rhodovulum sp.]
LQAVRDPVRAFAFHVQPLAWWLIARKNVHLVYKNIDSINSRCDRDSGSMSNRAAKGGKT